MARRPRGGAGVLRAETAGEALQAWRQELFDEELAAAAAGGERAWTHLSSSRTLLQDMRRSERENYRRMAEAVAAFAQLDAFQRLLVLETVVGRTASRADGLAALTAERAPEELAGLMLAGEALAASLSEEGAGVAAKDATRAEAAIRAFRELRFIYQEKLS